MSTPAPSIVNPLAGKRGACDRCHGQKLRCTRPNQNSDSLQVTCVRCFKAGASCSYGIAKRAGRSPASKSSSSQEQRGMSHEKPKMPSSASRPTTNPSGPSSFLDSETGMPEDTVLIHAESPSSLQDSSKVLSEVHLDFPASSAAATADLPWPDDIMTFFTYRDTEEASGLESFDSKHDWALQNYGTQSMNAQISNIGPNSNGEQHRHAGFNSYGVYVESGDVR